jgi:glycosyltransferase involved in cell wall biosynthesis
MSAETVVALVGRRDEPMDGVTDYCEWLGAASGSYGFQLETVRLCWQERGWHVALADLKEQAVAWRGRWVLLQYTTLAWSRRGFPLQAPRILSVLKKRGVRCGVVFHDFGPFVGTRVIDHVREFCHLRVLERLYAQAERAIFTVPIEKVSWLPPQREKAVFIPVGANCPETPQACRTDPPEARTVAVYCVTSGARMIEEVGDIGHALKRACRTTGRLNLIVFGRGSREADSALRKEFAGTGIEVQTLGLLSPQDVSRILSRADVMLFVRGQISSRRGSAIAGIACGLPVVGYAGPDTAWPITDAGFVPVPLGDREALSVALEKVLSDDPLRGELRERSRRAQLQHFSWNAIASRYSDTLLGHGETSSARAVADTGVVARTR